MMPFLQPSGRSSAGLSIRTTRILATLALVGAPAAVVIRALGPGTTDGSPHEIASLTVMIISLLAAASVFGSRLQRITREKARGTRRDGIAAPAQCVATSYFALTAIVMLWCHLCPDRQHGAAVAADESKRLEPHFVVLFLYALLFRTAVLAWRMEEEKEEG